MGDMAKTWTATAAWRLMLLAAVDVAVYSTSFNCAFGLRIGGDEPMFRTIFASGMVDRDIFKVALPILAIAV